VRTMGIILQLALYSAAVTAQAQQTKPAIDTSGIHPVGMVEPNLWKPVLNPPVLISPELNFELSFINDTRYGVPPPLLGGDYESKPDLIRPYLYRTRGDGKSSTLYSVLGAFELGGAAYIAYQHVKKYGLVR